VFHSLKKFHRNVSRRLLHLGIGARLFVLMALAAVLALVLAVAGVSGLGATKDSLRSVYEDRMMPVQHLTQIAKLMLSNRLLLQAALSEVRVDIGVDQRAIIVMDEVVATVAASAIENNIEVISRLWLLYASAALNPSESRAANQFLESRRIFVQEALQPAVVALRAGQYETVKTLADRAGVLYDEAGLALQALNQLQFDTARDAYTTAVQHYEIMRTAAISALLAAVSLMVWLGWMLATSIVSPLTQVIAIFKRISSGHYDSEITIEGHDEMSKVMLALRDMQTKLGVDEAAIHQLAFYDPLTRLPNRRLLRDRLQQALSLSERSHLYGAVLMIDLDNFKQINDTRGHDVGDQLLAEVALRVQSCVRQVDTVSRLGGDEFIVILVDLSPDEAQAALLAERLGEAVLASVNQPFRLGGKVHHSSASMGLCLFLGQSVSMEDLLKRADISMYQAKNSGRNALRFFDPQIQTSLEARIALESELHEALPNQQLRLYYQIQMDNALGVLGAEVLLRWEHPRHGLVTPDQFIPIAEESGLILPIGEWVLHAACAQVAVWSINPLTEPFSLSINVSARQFRQPDFIEMVAQALRKTGANPQRIKLELTESLVLHDIVDTVSKMRALTRHGIHFSMDDFGTGYSSLSHLTTLPIQQLKIDRSFVRNITHNHNDAVIVQTIIGMAKNLGVAVIAEGVETQAQRACLERFGCATFQGYLYGKPVPLREFEAQAMGLVSG
jgi:diguanylate cyclase (GGDEF)-like protein